MFLQMVVPTSTMNWCISLDLVAEHRRTGRRVR
jgi:hypothetical protein